MQNVCKRGDVSVKLVGEAAGKVTEKVFVDLTNPNTRYNNVYAFRFNRLGEFPTRDHRTYVVRTLPPAVGG